MALTTRCPHCGATFKVAAEQLQIRNGLVRCGVCASVFDGKASLLHPEAHETDTPQVFRPRGHVLHDPDRRGQADADTEDRVDYRADNVAADPVDYRVDDSDDDWADHSDSRRVNDLAPDGPVDVAKSYEARRGNDDVENDDDAERDGAERDDAEHGDDAERVTPFVGGLRAEREPQAGREPVWRDHSHADEHAVKGEARTRYVDDYHSGRRPPAFMDDGEQARVAHHASVWGAGCVLLFIILLGLITYTYRNQLAAALPALRPALVAACGPLKCEVNYERRIERISVMSSALRAPPGGASEPGQGQTLMLTVVLRNRYNAPQQWPTLVLDLKDIADRVVVRRNLQPAQYLPPDRVNQPFGPNAEQRITVPIAVRDVQVNGYQIDKFFP